VIRLLVAFVALLPLLIGPAPVVAAREEPAAVNSIDVKRANALEAGLRYLASNQNRDGSWGETKNGVVGVTALCTLAFLAQGHQEGRGPFAERDPIRRAVDFLLAASLPPSSRDPTLSANGMPAGYLYVKDDSDSRMHGHGYGTQVLVLAYGSGRGDDPRMAELREKIERAVAVIENSQTITGGWGYAPRRDQFHEGSVTVTVVQALRLARDAGFVVDREVIDRGLKYLSDSQKPDGSFKYSIMDDRSTAALTAAAIGALHGFGEYYTRSVRRGLDYIRRQYEHPGELEWTYYGNYYAAQAFYRAGGDLWERWKRYGVPWILDSQFRPGHQLGYWDDSRVGNTPFPRGRAYATAMSLLALSVPDGYLPLFQR